MAEDVYNFLIKIKRKEFTMDNGAQIIFQEKENTNNQMVSMMENG